MNYNTTYWRKIRNDTCYSYVLMSLLLFWRMTSVWPSRPFARCKTADFAFWAEQNVRETSRFFTKNPKEQYFCPVRFCQDESATSHTYEALTNCLILATIDGSRRNLFYYKRHGFWLTNHQFKKTRKTQGIAEDFQEVKLQLKFSTVWPSFSDFQPIIQLGKLLEVIFVLYKESITTLNNYFLYKISTFFFNKLLFRLHASIDSYGVLQVFWFFKIRCRPHDQAGISCFVRIFCYFVVIFLGSFSLLRYSVLYVYIIDQYIS